MSEPAVYQIDVNGKYILQVEEPLPAEEIERLARQMKEWLESDHPFLVVLGKVKLVKVEAVETAG